ncbi:MAG: plasmid maintenance system killer protein [Nitrospirales bacterium]|jgi:proteic killer suppression protein|nr:plasmid maintenance system killer protein [Nitrospirales bacterium]
MIENFKHRGLKRLYDKGDRSGLRTDIAEKAELYLSILDTAETVQELDILGFRFHRLTGNLRGFYSVTVSRNHRIIFRFKDGKAFDVDLLDYH